MEVSKGLVEFKMFKTKEECIEFKNKELEASKIWSDVKESAKGGWYVGYTLAGQLAAQAVQGSGDYYKMKIDLTAGYMLEYNWAGCH